MRKMFSEDMDEVGKRLKRLRRALHYTQAEMARELDVSVSHYSKLEVGIGCLGYKLMRVLARKYKVTREWLANGEGTEPDFSNFKPRALTRTTHTHEYLKNEEDNLEKIVDLAYHPDIVRTAESIVAATGISLSRAIALLVRQIVSPSGQVKATKEELRKLEELSKTGSEKGESPDCQRVPAGKEWV